jgi:pyruvate formate lyase activating enzyme
MRWGGLIPASLVDYPGRVAVTVFTVGCNLRCPYCHNAALVVPPWPEATWTDESVLRWLSQRYALTRAVCITGGEPTVYGTRLVSWIARLRAMGYDIKLDTNGTHPEIVRQLVQDHLVQYVAMDIKTAWAHYARVGGDSWVGRVQDTAALLQASPIDHEFRVTVAPDIVTESDLLAIARDLKGSRRLVLQQFRPLPNLLDPLWANKAPYPESVLKRWADLVSSDFTEGVSIRNLA